MDRITRLRIRNVRAIENVDLDIANPLTVLIGENGSGKSTIVECLELLRRAAEPDFIERFYRVHRGLPALLRKGAVELELGVVVEDDEGVLPKLAYHMKVSAQKSGAVIVSEQLQAGPSPDLNGAAQLERLIDDIQSAPNGTDTQLRRRVAASLRDGVPDRDSTTEIPAEIIGRDDSSTWIVDPDLHTHRSSPRADRLAITDLGSLNPHGSVDRLVGALRGIEVHLGFDSLAAWAARSQQRPLTIRGPATHFPAERVELLGSNLANAWSELRGRRASEWDRTLDMVRLGLGKRVDTVMVKPDLGGGNVYLALRFGDLPEPVLAADLSDGQIAWLAFVAMTRLNPNRSILAIDEPDIHLHPHLLAAVITVLEDIAAPVLISTHSDRVLELLDDPAAAVRVCALDDRGKATATQIDPRMLQKWLEKYGDIGRLRAAGYLKRVLRSEPSAPKPEAK